jgi:hypothetical protein
MIKSFKLSLKKTKHITEGDKQTKGQQERTEIKKS